MKIDIYREGAKFFAKPAEGMEMKRKVGENMISAFYPLAASRALRPRFAPSRLP